MDPKKTTATPPSGMPNLCQPAGVLSLPLPVHCVCASPRSQRSSYGCVSFWGSWPCQFSRARGPLRRGGAPANHRGRSHAGPGSGNPNLTPQFKLYIGACCALSPFCKGILRVHNPLPCFFARSTTYSVPLQSHIDLIYLPISMARTKGLCAWATECPLNTSFVPRSCGVLRLL